MMSHAALRRWLALPVAQIRLSSINWRVSSGDWFGYCWSSKQSLDQ